MRRVDAELDARFDSGIGGRVVGSTRSDGLLFFQVDSVTQI